MRKTRLIIATILFPILLLLLWLGVLAGANSDSSFVWLTLIPLVGIVLLVVYLSILVSCIKEVITTRKEGIAYRQLATYVVFEQCLAVKEQAEKEAEEAEEQAKKEGIAARCPKCNKPWARVDNGSVVIRKEPGYETITTEEYVHRNYNGEETGRTRRSERIPYNLYTIRTSYHCKFCKHKWADISYR